MKVLLVDDEQDILESTGEFLRASGHDVVLVDESRRVLETIRATRPDVILHDVRMPGLDLRAHLKAIRADPAVGRTPLVLFTATLSARELAREVGADDGLEKPFRPDDLLALLEKWHHRAGI